MDACTAILIQFTLDYLRCLKRVNHPINCIQITQYYVLYVLATLNSLLGNTTTYIRFLTNFKYLYNTKIFVSLN